MNETDLKILIKNEEGLKLIPYVDILGHLTVGWGRCLENGINVDEAELMFENDFNQTKRELEQLPFYKMQSLNIKFALINMNFNLGIRKLLTFKKMINALINHNYDVAANEALNSLWAKQVPNRAHRIAAMIREG